MTRSIWRWGPKTFDVKVGAIIMATGWKPYDAEKIDNLGFGRYADVITNVMMERLAAPNGPTQGKIIRPSDGQPANTVVFVQCAGQRDENHLGYCSGICCLGSLKQATYVREQNLNAKAFIFYIDLRAPGTYAFFAKKVQSDPNVAVIKGKVAKIVEDPATRMLIVEAEDILSAEKISVEADLVVLATGMVANMADGRPGSDLGYDKDHFLLPGESAPGIFRSWLCTGACRRGNGDPGRHGRCPEGDANDPQRSARVADERENRRLRVQWVRHRRMPGHAEAHGDWI